MSNESDYRDVREALRYTSEALKDSAKESQALALTLAGASAELQAVKKELERGRNDREGFAVRLTLLESMEKRIDKIESALEKAEDAIAVLHARVVAIENLKQGSDSASDKASSKFEKYSSMVLALIAVVVSIVFGIIK